MHRSPLRPLLAAAALLLGLAGPVALPAQDGPTGNTVGVTVETLYRWLHEDAPSGSVPFEAERDDYRATRQTFPGWDGYVEIERGVIQVSATWDRREPPSGITVQELRRAGSFRDEGSSHSVALQLSGHRREQRPILYLPETIAWEMLVPAPAGLAPGDRWADTVDFRSAPLDSVQEHFGGVWRYEVEGDTVLLGRPLPLIRFEADVQIRRRRALDDPARSPHLRLEREASGRMAGWFVLDTLNGVRVEGVDSTRLAGVATLQGTDHPDWTSGVVYEQERRWVAETEEREAARLAEWDRSYGGMLLPPETPPEAPPSRGVVDSLWAALIDSADPDRRRELQWELQAVTDRDWQEVRDEAAARLLANGDPILALEPLVHGSADLRLDSASWAFYRPYLDDPARLWRLGLTPGGAWDGLTGALLWSAPWSGRPEAEWACVPEECATIVAQMESSPNPVLRETALVGRFVQDPSSGASALEAAWEGGATHLGEAVRYARGVGAQWPAAPKAPMPEAEADWREWRWWMGDEVRFETSHRRALAVYQERTGRDPLADLVDRWDDLEGDSARLVVGFLLRSADRLDPPTAEELVRDLLGDSEPLREAAQRELRNPRGTLEPLADAEAVEFLTPLLDSILAFGTSPWPSVPEEEHRGRLGQDFHGLDEGARYLIYERTDEELVRALSRAAGVEARSLEAWESMDRRSAAVGIVFERPSRQGAIIRLVWSWDAWAERADDAVPRGYGGGGTLWLAPSENGWVTVSRSGWIT